MQRLALTAVLAVGLIITGASPAFASSGASDAPHGTLNLWCTPDNNGGVFINGTLTVQGNDRGPVTLALYGVNRNVWSSAGQNVTIQTIPGQFTYGFGFDAQASGDNFERFRVDGDGTSSRVIGRDECGFRVPEAPASSILLLGALPVVALVGMRVAGIRLPSPNWRRVG